MAAILAIQNLHKRYGKLDAVHNLSFEIEQGSVFGFIGPNGAGKTTTMRILTTLLKPTSGEAWVAGHSITRDPRGVRRVIGYMPDFFGVYHDMKVWEYLDFFAACYDIPEAQRPKLIEDLLQLVDLAHRRDDMVDSLSRGMKQRLCLARTLAHDPEVLILDEPAAGLDPRARVEMRELLRELSAMGKTIFFSSHVLSEVEEICSHIGIIEAGQLVAAGSVDEMRRRLTPHRVIRLVILDKLPQAKEILMRVPGVTEMADVPDHPNHLRLSLTGDDAALAEALRALVASDVPVSSFTEETGDLEDVFMRLTKGIVS